MANKYQKLMNKKKGMYTTDNRPIEVYKKGKEKLYVAFSPSGEMEIISHNPLPFLSALSATPAVVGAVKSIFKKEDKADRIPKEKTSRKSLAQEIIEAEVYGDRQF